MYRYMIQIGSDYVVVTAKQFRKKLPNGSTIRSLKRKHWTQCRAQELFWGAGKYPIGLLHGPRNTSADFCVCQK